MRNKNDRNEFKEQQDAEIMAAYRRIFSVYGGKVGAGAIYRMVSFAPASRFFVSARQAFRVVSVMAEGGDACSMLPTKRRMYSEILRRAALALDSEPSMTLREAVGIVVCQPAPEMYIGVRQVAAIIKKEKIRCYEERKRRLSHCF